MSSSPSRLSCPRKRASSNRRGGNRMSSSPLAPRIFPLTRVTRIFQKNVFTKTAPAGPGGTPLGIFCCAGAVLFPEDTKRCVKAAAPRGQTRCNRWLQETVFGWVPIVVGLLFTMNAATSTCPRGIGLEPRRAIAALRRQQDLAAGGRQIGHPQPRFGLRRRRRPRVEHGVGEPIREFLAAAVVRRPRRLRLAFCVVGRADEPNVKVKVVSPPRLHLAEPMAVAAGVAAQGFLDRRVHEDAGDLRVLRSEEHTSELQ